MPRHSFNDANPGLVHKRRRSLQPFPLSTQEVSHRGRLRSVVPVEVLPQGDVADDAVH